MTQRGNVIELRRQWAHLPAPTQDDLTGELVAAFVAPLRRIAPAGLGLVGLPAWYGKRFRREGDVLTGVNLIRTPGGLAQRLPMTARLDRSLVDGRPVIAVTYGSDAPLPWRWVRDELRIAPDGTVVAVTLTSLPGLSRLGGLPFILRRATSIDDRTDVQHHRHPRHTATDGAASGEVPGR